METVSENACFGGTQGVYRHASPATGTDMTFGLFLPREAADGPVPILWFLSGLTCTHENAMTKSGIQAHAAEAGIAVVFPDTSPRGENVANEEAFDMGQGAGFYVNATQAPWSQHFRMWDYIAEDLSELLTSSFPIDPDRQAITGHSMGGHGALTLGMGLPGRYRSISAFSPMCNTLDSEWGAPQLTKYLGPDRSAWTAHDASHVMANQGFDGPVLVDIGTDDQFWDKLKPAALANAIAERRQDATLRLQPGYDHSYFFVSTFVGDHVDFHAEALWR